MKNYFKISQEYFQNFCKLSSDFLEKQPRRLCHKYLHNASARSQRGFMLLSLHHTVHHTPVFFTKNRVSRILVFSSKIATLVICLIFLTENAIESHVLQQFHNKIFRFSAINIMIPKYE